MAYISITSTVIRVGLLQWQVPACVFTCVQGLLIPQGLDLGCYEQMVIITKAQKAAAEDRRGGVALSLCIARLISTNLDGVILFSTRPGQERWFPVIHSVTHTHSTVKFYSLLLSQIASLQ